MALHCRGCGSNVSHHTQTRIVEGELRDTCDRCGSVGNAGVPDVYFKGPHTNPNITDLMGRPIELTSRRHKADVLRKQNAREAGDSYHGTKQGAFKHL